MGWVMLRALRAYPKGRCPSGRPALAAGKLGGQGWRASPFVPAPSHIGLGRLHQHQGSASPTSSPDPCAALRAAASGVALDTGSG
ncbi:hypothetical protein X994_6616 (plasmid) [Burkholderia pseudomallei]|nr:hypothetical protein X994_6616 [Burkholderia pseudomallei]